jgi:hypothetical protein
LEFSDGKDFMGGLVLLLLGGGSLAAILAIQLRVQLRKREVEAQAAQLVKDEPLLDPSCGVLAGLRKTFGDAKNADLLVMQRDRESLIAEVLNIAKPDAAQSRSGAV